MFKNMLKLIGISAIGYVVYKVGYSNGLKTADKTLQDLENDLLNRKISIQEYMQKVNDRINELEGRC